MYQSDIEYKFDMKPEEFQGLIDNVDSDVEGGLIGGKLLITMR